MDSLYSNLLESISIDNGNPHPENGVISNPSTIELHIPIEADKTFAFDEINIGNNSIPNIESAKGNAIDSDPIALPGRIANALVLVYEGFREMSLSENHRRVLSCLIRFGVNLNDPSRDIFIKKSTIATKLTLNEATVYRSLTALEQAGLIARTEQKREGRNWKTIGYIRLTDIALGRLGLSRRRAPATHERTPETSEKTIESSEPIDNNILAALQDVNHEPKQSSLKNHSPRESFEKIDNRRVPSDLAWLHINNQLKLSGLFKLMKDAKLKGTRLSDVVKHSATTLKQFRGRELYAYLSTLIGLPIDFTFVAKQASAERLKKLKKAEEKAAFDATVAQLTHSLGRTYRCPRGDMWEVDHGSFLVSSPSTGRSGSVPFSLAPEAVAAVLSSDWVEIQKSAGLATAASNLAVAQQGARRNLTMAATDALSRLKTHLRGCGFHTLEAKLKT